MILIKNYNALHHHASITQELILQLGLQYNTIK